MRRGLFLALGLGLATIAEAGAQEAKDPRAVLTAASARIAAAGQALAAAQANGTVDATALATAIDAYQEALAALRAGVRDATGEEQALTVALEARREEVSRLLAALEMMSRTPPPAQGLHPDGPIGAARAGAMMSELTPALADEALEDSGYAAQHCVGPSARRQRHGRSCQRAHVAERGPGPALSRGRGLGPRSRRAAGDRRPGPDGA